MRFIYIDDHAVNRRIVNELLRLIDVECDEAADAVSGIAMIEAAAYDGILVDLHMPDVDGLEATRRIRALGERWLHVPVIAITADTTPGIAERCANAGVDELVPKPVDLDVLADAIARAMLKHAPDGLSLT